jgi:hypothetical protein
VASKQHQRILALVLRRMHELGFTVVACDGVTANLGNVATRIPARFGRHRPDAVGVREDGVLCIGEAKTASDMRSTRTRDQMTDYLATVDEEYACVVVGYPQSADASARKLLEEIGGTGAPQLTLLCVPDELVDD